MMLSFFAILMLSILTGCETLQSLANSASKPEVKITDAKLQDLSLDKVNLVLDVDISNPYSLPLPLSNLKYALASDGQNFLEGDAGVQGTIPANSSKTLPIPVAISYIPMLQVLKGVTPGSVIPYTAKLDLSVDAPGVGPITLPVEKEGELPIPAVPEVSLTNVEWQELSLNKAQATLNLEIKNTNEFPIELNQLQYKLHLGDVPVAQNQITQSTKFGENATNTLKLPISLSPMQLGLAAFSLLQGKGSSYKMEGGLKVGSPFGPIELPFSKNGETTFTK